MLPVNTTLHQPVVTPVGTYHAVMVHRSHYHPILLLSEARPMGLTLPQIQHTTAPAYCLPVRFDSDSLASLTLQPGECHHGRA